MGWQCEECGLDGGFASDDPSMCDWGDFEHYHRTIMKRDPVHRERERERAKEREPLPKRETERQTKRLLPSFNSCDYLHVLVSNTPDVGRAR